MRDRQSLNDLQRVAQHVPKGQRTSPQALAQRRPLEQFGDDERDPLVLRMSSPHPVGMLLIW
jgi:hypothetical protein